MPASAPGPKTATKSSAQTSEFTERDDTRMNLATRLSVADGVTLRAASSATGTESTSAMTVPSVAVWKVSTSASATISRQNDQSIGHIRRNRSAVCSGAS